MTRLSICVVREPNDLRVVAELHRQLLGDSQLTRLGAPFLTRLYYPTLVVQGFGDVLLARIDGEAAGFASFTYDTRAFLAKVAAQKAAMAGCLLRGMVRRPVEVLGAVLCAAATMNGTGDEPGVDISAEFLSFGVLPQYRDAAFTRSTGVSVAKTLFAQVRDSFRDRGIPRFKLFPPAEEDGKIGPALLYRMMGAKQVWRGEVRNAKVSMFVCETGAPDLGHE